MRNVEREVEIFVPRWPQGKTANVKAVWQVPEVIKQQHPGVEKDRKNRKTPVPLRVQWSMASLEGKWRKRSHGHKKSSSIDVSVVQPKATWCICTSNKRHFPYLIVRPL